MNRLFAWLGSLITWKSTLRDQFAPYPQATANELYNSLFCDRLPIEDTETPNGDLARGDWSVLLAKEPYMAGLQSIATDKSRPSRMRLLAHKRLRDAQQTMATQELLGVVVESRTAGLEVLAAYADGCVIKIAADGTVVQRDSDSAIAPHLRALFAAAQTAVDQIGPWLPPRATPPSEGMIRMSFLVSDGLYFGQGLIDVMRNDALAGPIIQAAEALGKVVARASIRTVSK